MLARNKLDRIERKIFLLKYFHFHEDFMTILNKERYYRELKESIRMMKGQADKKVYID